MAIVWTTVRQNIFNWIDAVSGSTVIWAEQAKAQPSPQFITLKILAGPGNIGEDELRMSSSDVFFTAGERLFTLSIQSHGSNAQQDIIDILGSLGDPEIYQTYLRANGLAIRSIPFGSDATEQLDTVFEQRKILDIQLAIVHNKDTAVTYIESVEIEADYNDGQVTQTFTIPP